MAHARSPAAMGSRMYDSSYWRVTAVARAACRVRGAFRYGTGARVNPVWVGSRSPTTLSRSAPPCVCAMHGAVLWPEAGMGAPRMWAALP
eukprot:956641-Rhodomonas_salina.1